LIRPTTSDDSLFATARGFGRENSYRHYRQLLWQLLERLFEERFKCVMHELVAVSKHICTLRHVTVVTCTRNCSHTVPVWAAHATIRYHRTTTDDVFLYFVLPPQPVMYPHHIIGLPDFEKNWILYFTYFLKALLWNLLLFYTYVYETSTDWGHHIYLTCILFFI